MVCQGLGITAEEVEGMGDVQPALIDAEGLHQVRVLLVDGVDLFGDLPVQFVVGWQQHQLRALFLGLPDGFRRLDAEFFAGSFLARMMPWREVGSPQTATGTFCRSGRLRSSTEA